MILFFGNLDLSSADAFDNIMRRFAVYCAAHTLTCAKNLLHTPCKVLCQRFGFEDTGDFDNLVQGNVASVFDVLLLFPVSWGLCEKEFETVGQGVEVLYIPLRARMTKELAEGTTDTVA